MFIIVISYTIYKDTCSRNEEYMEYEAEAKHNEEIAKEMEHQKLNGIICKQESTKHGKHGNIWNDYQKDCEKCRKKLQDEI